MKDQWEDQGQHQGRSQRCGTKSTGESARSRVPSCQGKVAALRNKVDGRERPVESAFVPRRRDGAVASKRHKRWGLFSLF